MNGFSQFSRYLWLVSSIFLITSLFGYLYFLETEKKGDYFNQLYFRNLGEISSNFEINLVRLLNFTSQVNKNSKEIIEKLEQAERLVRGDTDTVDEYAVSQYAQYELELFVENADPVTLHEYYLDEVLFYYDELEAGLIDISAMRTFPCERTDNAEPLPIHVEQYCELAYEVSELSELVSRAASGSISGQDVATLRGALDQLERLMTRTTDLEDALEQVEEVGYQRYLALQTLDFLLQLRELRERKDIDVITSGFAEMPSMLQLAGGVIYDASVLTHIEQLLTSPSCPQCDLEFGDLEERALTIERNSQRNRLKQILEQLVYLDVQEFVAEHLASLQSEIEFFLSNIEGAPTLEGIKQDIRELEANRNYFLSEGGSIAVTAARHGLKPRFLRDRGCPVEAEAIEAADGLSGTLADLRAEARRIGACKDVLFIGRATQRTPYPGGNIAVTSFLGDDGALETPIENFLPRSLVDFASILVADGAGAVIVQLKKRSDEVSHNFLDVSHLLEKARSGTGTTAPSGDGNSPPEPGALAHSTFVDEDIGGIRHRIYIYPYQTSEMRLRVHNAGKSSRQLYFVGVKPLSEITENKLRISPGYSATLLSVVLIILLAFVFLKIQLAHIDASFTKLEAAIAGMSLVTLVVITVSGLTTMATGAQLAEETGANAQAAIKALQRNFRDELEAHIHRVDGLLKDNRLLARNLSSNPDGLGGIPASISASPCTHSVSRQGVWLRSNLPSGKQGVSTYAIDNLFMLRADGSLAGALLRGTEHLVSPTNPNLSARWYFNRALENDVWEIPLDAPRANFDSCEDTGQIRQSSNQRNPYAEQMTQQELEEHPAEPELAPLQHAPLVLERIFNLTDGRRSTQFAIPISYSFAGPTARGQPAYDAMQRYNIQRGLNASEKAEEPALITFGLTMRSLHNPVLQSGLNFAVIENSSGRVLYHSDDERSLVENFFQETENNPKLRAQIRAAEGMQDLTGGEPAAANDHHDEWELKQFTGLYRGANSRFWADQLHPQIPWTLVVFDDSGDRRSGVTLLFTVSILLCLGTLSALLLVLAIMSALRIHALHWLWPQESKFGLYPALGIAALVLAAPYYFLLVMMPNPLLFVLLVLTASLAAMYSLTRVFARLSWLKHSPHRRRSLRNRYSLFVLSLLFLLVAIPASVATRKAANETFLLLTLYESMKTEERRDVAVTAIDQQMQRLCGSDSATSQRFQRCASLFGEPPAGQASRDWEADATWLDNLTRPTHIFDVNGCEAGHILCASTVGEVRDKARAGFVSDTVLLLENLWRLPTVLNAVKLENPEIPAYLGTQDGVAWFLHFRTPLLMELMIGKPLVVLLLAVAVVLILGAISFLAVSLLGINVPRSYRADYMRLDSRSWSRYVDGNWRDSNKPDDLVLLVGALREDQRHLAILIRPDPSRLEILDEKLGPALFKSGEASTIDALQLVEDDWLSRQMLSHCERNPGTIVLLENLESIAFNKARRLKTLQLLEQLAAETSATSLVLISDVAPLYMLTHQSRYIPNSMLAECADAQEIVRWSRLLSRFLKYYGWSPADLDFVDEDDAENTVLREVSAWPELYPFKLILDGMLRRGFSQEQVVQYVATHAGPVYRRRWSLCTKEEKLLLYQLARNQLINPDNIEPLEHLLRRGFVRRNPEWSIVNKSFARFVLTAEEEATYVKWMKASEQGLWKILRIPLFTGALVIIGILMYSAQEAIESFLALATGVLALLPLLLRNFNLVRGAPGSTPTENSS